MALDSSTRVFQRLRYGSSTCMRLQNVSDPRLHQAHRVFNALGGLARLCCGEIAGLRWRHYDPRQRPLGRLLPRTAQVAGDRLLHYDRLGGALPRGSQAQGRAARGG